MSQGKLKEAETISRQALEVREKMLGAEHPETLSSVNMLARALYNQGKLGTAEELRQRALESGEKLLGKDHPDTLKLWLVH